MGPRVLVVDDEADIRELLELTLSRMGLDVDERRHRSPRPSERLKAERYDLCLTDMRLPDGDGLELVAHIAEHQPTSGRGDHRATAAPRTRSRR